jgi:hypothetical protein
MTGLELGLTGASVGGNFLQNYLAQRNANQQREEDRETSERNAEESRRQFNTRAMLDMLNLDEAARQSNLDQGLQVAQQVPNRVNWRQNQALAAAILPGLRNASVSSNIPGMNSFIPQVQGGFRIPEGGFSPETMKFFEDEAMLQGEVDLDRAGLQATEGLSTPPQYSNIYTSSPSTAPAAQTQLSNVATNLQEEQRKRIEQRNAALQQALGVDPQWRSNVAVPRAAANRRPQ